MQKQEIFQVIKSNVIKVLPDIGPENVTIDISLKDLGANSVDRVEIVQYCMEELHLKIPRVEFGKARDLSDLLEILSDHINT